MKRRNGEVSVRGLFIGVGAASAAAKGDACTAGCLLCGSGLALLLPLGSVRRRGCGEANVGAPPPPPSAIGAGGVGVGAEEGGAPLPLPSAASKGTAAAAACRLALALLAAEGWAVGASEKAGRGVGVGFIDEVEAPTIDSLKTGASAAVVTAAASPPRLCAAEGLLGALPLSVHTSPPTAGTEEVLPLRMEVAPPTAFTPPSPPPLIGGGAEEDEAIGDNGDPTPPQPPREAVPIPAAAEVEGG